MKRDAILINASLLLDYQKVSDDTYRSVGVKPDQIKHEPFHLWLGAAMNGDIELASELQVARDARLAPRLFDPKFKVRETGILDLVHLFVEAQAQAYITSYESPDALNAIVARANLPEQIERFSLVANDRRHEVVTSILNSEMAPEWLLVYELGLTARQEQRILAALGSRGVLINVRSWRLAGEATEQALRLIEERWT